MRRNVCLLFTLIFTLLVSTASIASNFDDFNRHIQDRDFKKAKKVLDTWGRDKDNDPQYYICLFNYHLNKSRTEGIGIQKQPPEDEKVIEVTDPKTGAVVGYFAPIVHYDAKEAHKGIDHLKKGIARFPDHYEMRFGILYSYKELYELDKYLVELESALSYYQKHKPKKIYWNNNETITDPGKFIIETVQGNFAELLQNEAIQKDPDFAHTYCDLVIKYFPRHKYGYANKGALYSRDGKFKQALDYFLKAGKLDPNDELIVSNIGFLYLEMKDTASAKKYFKQVIKISKDDFYVKGAKEQLKLLERN